jgi:hypothetical protein
VRRPELGGLTSSRRHESGGTTGSRLGAGRLHRLRRERPAAIVSIIGFIAKRAAVRSTTWRGRRDREAVVAHGRGIARCAALALMRAMAKRGARHRRLCKPRRARCADTNAPRRPRHSEVQPALALMPADGPGRRLPVEVASMTTTATSRPTSTTSMATWAGGAMAGRWAALLQGREA